MVKFVGFDSPEAFIDIYLLAFVVKVFWLVFSCLVADVDYSSLQ